MSALDCEPVCGFLLVQEIAKEAIVKMASFFKDLLCFSAFYRARRERKHRLSRGLGAGVECYIVYATGHQLIQSRIYRRIRHPFYLGGLLSLPGVLLAFRSPLSLIIFAISALFVVNRIGREERLLMKEFPQAYSEYRNYSWHLVPHVY